MTSNNETGSSLKIQTQSYQAESDGSVDLKEKPTENQIQVSEPPSPVRQRNSPNILLFLVVIALLAGTGYGIYRLFFYQPKLNSVFLSGRIESYETDVSAKIGGQIVKVSVREGDLVKPGQALVEIEDADLRAQLRAAAARVRAAQQRLERTRQQLPIMQVQLEQANLITQQVTQESQGRVVEAQNALAAAKADLTEAQADLKLAQAVQSRSRELFAQGAVSAQQRDQDNARSEVAVARVEAARQKFLSTQGMLTQAQARLRETSIRTAAALQIHKQITQARTDITIAEHELQEAKAQQAEIQARLNYQVIKSPMTGSVITRSVEPGEVVAAGTPLLTIVNLNNLYLRGFIPAGQIGQVKVGQKGLVYLDSSTNQPLTATVTRIDPKASFTPKNVYFKKDRVTQVFGVQLTLNNNQSLAKPGVPADGKILLPETKSQRSPLKELIPIIR